MTTEDPRVAAARAFTYEPGSTAVDELAALLAAYDEQTEFLDGVNAIACDYAENSRIDRKRAEAAEAERDQLATVAAQQAESITRVLTLHSPNRPADDDGDCGQCDGCLAVDPGGYCPWPCPTIAALDGPTEDTEPGDPS